MFDSTKGIESKQTVRTLSPLTETAQVAFTIPAGTDPHPKEGKVMLLISLTL